jgi:hypothetical protein
MRFLQIEVRQPPPTTYQQSGPGVFIALCVVCVTTLAVVAAIPLIAASAKKRCENGQKHDRH